MKYNSASIETIEQKAKKFAKQLKNNIVYSSVKEYAETKLCYKVLYIGSKQGEEKIKELGLEKERKLKAYTYRTAATRIIFLSSLPETERLLVLLHECGHIELGHLDVPSYELDSIKAEQEADQFAYAVLMAGAKQANNVYKKLSIILGILFIISVIVFSGITAFNFGKSATDTQNASPFQTATKTKTESSEAAVYATIHGTKYHKPDCYHIAGKDNLRTLTKADAEKSYTPCKICKP